jgi:hypothetical protein
MFEEKTKGLLLRYDAGLLAMEYELSLFSKGISAAVFRLSAQK